MRWVRTWPERIPPGRSYVVDGIPKILMSGHDYAPVLAQLDGDTVIVEWDLAVSPEDIRAFENWCEIDPEEVHVAPYRLYPVSTGLPAPVWAHRRVGRASPWITKGDAECDLFGFGLVYLPLAVVRRHLDAKLGVTGDARFSQWHYGAGLGPVQVHWDVRPIHLHY